MGAHDKDDFSGTIRHQKLLQLSIQDAISVLKLKMILMQEPTVWNPFTMKIDYKSSQLVKKLLAMNIKNCHLKWFCKSSSTFQAYLHKWVHVCRPFSKTLCMLHWKMLRATNNAVSDMVGLFNYSNTFKM